MGTSKKGYPHERRNLMERGGNHFFENSNNFCQDGVAFALRFLGLFSSELNRVT